MTLSVEEIAEAAAQRKEADITERASPIVISALAMLLELTEPVIITRGPLVCTITDAIGKSQSLSGRFAVGTERAIVEGWLYEAIRNRRVAGSEWGANG